MVVEKKYHFYAAHRNKSAGIKCGRLHGHTYEVICSFKFEKLENGITMLFSDIDKIVEPIIKKYDHYLLLHDEDPLCDLLDSINEEYVPLPFETSAENLCLWIFSQITQYLPIKKIQLAETKSSNVIYEVSN